MKEPLKFNHINSNKKAIIHQYNAYFRLLDGDNKEHFFYSLDNAIQHLLKQGYIVELGTYSLLEIN